MKTAYAAAVEISRDLQLGLNNREFEQLVSALAENNPEQEARRLFSEGRNAVRALLGQRRAA